MSLSMRLSPRIMTKNPIFSIIIVNYNGAHYTLESLKSVLNQSFTDFEVIIIDNNSSDNSMQLVLDNLCGRGTYTKDNSPRQVEARTASGASTTVHLRPSSSNQGFAVANNLAAYEARGEWLVLLNPDAYAAPDWLETLAAASHRHPSTHAFASAQYDMHNQDLLDGAGDAYFGFGIPWRGGFGHPVAELPAEGRCFSPCGAGAMIKRDTFLYHGGFDESFFCYCEDVDLGYRMQLAGERCIFVPSARIDHAGSAISGRMSEFSIYYGTRNRLWTYLKNTPLRILIWTVPGHFFLMLIILFRNRKTDQHGSMLKGLRDGLKGLGPIWRKRREIKANRKVSIWQLVQAMCWNPITLHKRRPDVRPIKHAVEIQSTKNIKP